MDQKLDSQQSLSIKCTRRAKIAQIGTFTKETENIWIVLHGYGMLSQFFIRKFKTLSDDKTVILAPEGLSRFYSEGTYGRVGASWMTKEERTNEIEDQMDYFKEINKTLHSKMGSRNFELTLLGFSQGASTAWRISQKSILPINHLILWAGGIPAEGIINGDISSFKTTIVYNTEDQFIPREKAENYCKEIRLSCPQIKIVESPGKHDINIQSIPLL